jgi:serine/threonine protein kinase/tetratricopeptide (TPR) repeat protein
MSLPELFGPYLLHHRLAQGTTSEVFLAQTTGEFPRICAVKRILPALAALPEFGERFRRDAALLVRFAHGNLVQVLEVGAVEERPFVAMEHIDGVELADFVAQAPEQGPLPPELALYVGLEVCEAVSYIEQRRREEYGAPTFPPDAAWPLEVMLAFDGLVKVVDLGGFGALRLGQERVGHVLSSPGYAVPEVIRKQPLDVRSDLFAIGTIVWEVLAGQRLATADPEAYVRGVLSGTWSAPLVQRKDAPGDVIRLVAELLQLDPARRPSSIEEVRRRLVGGLRRLAPTYGSAALSGMLWRRCRAAIGQHEDLMAEVVLRAQTVPKRAAAMRTATYGRAGEPRPVEPPRPLQVGDVISGTRYRMVRSLGQGGCAEVYAAQHVDLDRQVAIKIISPQLAADAVATTQFRMEARACSRVRHPNIVDVIDFGELTDGRFFFAMELLDGQSLGEVIEREGSLRPERAIGIFRQIAKALGAAHEQGIVHRDLKPDNVMLVHHDGRDDVVKVLDFGVMALASEESGHRVGTAGYMAPEQCRGEKPTAAMDIYALGTSLYEALCGEIPYAAESIEEFVQLQASAPPPALRSRPAATELHPALERVVHRALERDPAARHPSMADFEAELIRAEQEAGLHSDWDDLPPPGEVRDHRPRTASSELRPRRGRGGIYLGTALGVMALGVVGVLWYGAGRDRRDAAASATSSPAPPSQAPASRPSSALEDLLRRAEVAAEAGYFRHPAGENALELLREAERSAPEASGRVGELRRRLARMLAGAADRLIAGGLNRAARTLYEEAQLFDPGLPMPSELAALAATPASHATSRPAANVAELAWLLSQVQLAVAEGRYLKPPRRSALRYLERLKQLDPTGTRTADARQVMTTNLRRKADQHWREGDLAAALPLYRMVLILSPDDVVARSRGRAALDGGAARVARPSPAETADRADPARAAQLVEEGKKLLAEGKLAEARTRFRAAIKADSNDVRAVIGLASVAFEQAHYDTTVELAKRALKIDRRQTQAQLLLGDAYFKLLRHDDARRAWQEALRVQPGNRSAARRLEKLEKTK